MCAKSSEKVPHRVTTNLGVEHPNSSALRQLLCNKSPFIILGELAGSKNSTWICKRF